ncbi:methyltransferase family protein [Nostoc parmelioides]|uniref:Isoprenylcysteine carboxylmethyltransferase family protein n=1 Tax=Nostoc parmelioides FACHB-3921 TaxID=2692909 RepID=A0ABR8BMV3_9NOSO|nr:isoprenylcysteine carboxylmethyltransferase family protein [Nostoc parmelioides]MBD2255009.1 isoprenylcysteine carboxylmethyltransferase family protein [Nostoc parmelioides FACHB-3921]
MTSKAVLAYLLIACYFIMERLLRVGDKALSLQAGEFDRGSSKVIWISGLLGIILILFAPMLNVNQIGDWNSGYFGWLGLLLMVIGLVLRYWAAKTLGRFYTRTLQTLENQQIIQQAPYNIIRHPGYLGTFLMEIGASLAIANWIILIVIAVMGALSRFYRIQVEEEMLKTVLGGQYIVYSQETWKLIPFIY